MMLIEKKLGNLNDFEAGSRAIDRIQIQWFETRKKILHKRSSRGRDVVVKMLNSKEDFIQDDVVHEDETSLLVISILPCAAIVVRPGTMHEMAAVCYETGNKHLPVFYEDGEIRIPWEEPLFKLLESLGYQPQKKTIILQHPLKTSVSPHAHGGQSLLTKILKRTNYD
jgi:urease accessory protein